MRPFQTTKNNSAGKPLIYGWPRKCSGERSTQAFEDFSTTRRTRHLDEISNSGFVPPKRTATTAPSHTQSSAIVRTFTEYLYSTHGSDGSGVAFLIQYYPFRMCGVKGIWARPFERLWCLKNEIINWFQRKIITVNRLYTEKNGWSNKLN